MATVIGDIHNSRILNKRFQIDVFASYIDGRLPVRILYSVYAYLKFLTLYKKYDLFHIHTASYGSTFRKYCYLKVIKRAGKKAVVHIHGAKYLVFYEHLGSFGKKIVLRYLKGADMVLALSESWKKKFDSVFHLENCRVLENGIDQEKFSEAADTQEEETPAFAVLGRLGKRKGTYDLLEALETAVKQAPGLRCYLAGDGETDKAKEIIKNKGLEKNAAVLGWIGPEETIRLLKRVSVVVLPSYNEGLPMSVLEGMAAGKAVISTRVGAIPEVIGEENGILIEPGDQQALAAALVWCCGNREEIRKMSANNIEKIQTQFSLERMHGKLAEYYEECSGL